MKTQEKKYSKELMETSPHKKIFIRKMFTIIIALYCIYRLGYGIGTFFAHIAF